MKPLSSFLHRMGQRGVVPCVAGLLMLAALPVAAQSRTGRIEKISVHGASLEGNLLGDPAERDVFVYLPPSYASNPTRHYPTVYILHGYGRVAESWVPYIGLPASMDTGIAKGVTQEMILVLPDANTTYGGSMFSSSPTTGDWETYIAQDLVSYIDSHYRTIPTRASRGLAGHSMGGYGTVRIAMKFPQVFSSFYALAPCCLMNNPQPRPATPAKPAAAAKPAPTKPAAAPAKPTEGHPVDVQSGEAAAWSPNPHNPPLYFDRPVVDDKLLPEIAAKWIANSPLAMLDQYAANLKKYDAIALDVGLDDTLLNSVRELDQSLTRLNLTHSFETYDGDHTNHVKDRMEEKVFPFFSQHLTFEKALGKAPAK